MKKIIFYSLAFLQVFYINCASEVQRHTEAINSLSTHEECCDAISNIFNEIIYNKCIEFEKKKTSKKNPIKEDKQTVSTVWRSFLKSGALVNAKDFNGRNILLTTLLHNNLMVSLYFDEIFLYFLELLIANGLNINELDNNERTIIYDLVMNIVTSELSSSTYFDKLLLILDNFVMINKFNTKDKYGDNIFMFMIKTLFTYESVSNVVNLEDLINLLLEKLKININDTNNEDLSLLGYATYFIARYPTSDSDINEKRSLIISALIKAGCYVNEIDDEGYTLLAKLAIEFEMPNESLKMLLHIFLRSGFDVTKGPNKDLSFVSIIHLPGYEEWLKAYEYYKKSLDEKPEILDEKLFHEHANMYESDEAYSSDSDHFDIKEPLSDIELRNSKVHKLKNKLKNMPAEQQSKFLLEYLNDDKKFEILQDYLDSLSEYYLPLEETTKNSFPILQIYNNNPSKRKMPRNFVIT